MTVTGPPPPKPADLRDPVRRRRRATVSGVAAVLLGFTAASAGSVVLAGLGPTADLPVAPGEDGIYDGAIDFAYLASVRLGILAGVLVDAVAAPLGAAVVVIAAVRRTLVRLVAPAAVGVLFGATALIAWAADPPRW